MNNFTEQGIVEAMYLNGIKRAIVHLHVGSMVITVHRQKTKIKIEKIARDMFPVSCSVQVKVDTSHSFIKNKKKGNFIIYRMAEIKPTNINFKFERTI